jgi:hypothetical protein
VMRRAGEWGLPVVAKPFHSDATRVVMATALRARRA